MSHISAAVAQRLAYHDMKPLYYYLCTIIMYGLIVLCAITVTNITTVFDIVSAVAVSFIAFFIPAILYLRIPKVFPGKALINQATNTWLARIFFLLGLINFTLGLASVVIGLLSGESSH